MINKSDSRCAVVRFCYHSYGYRPNWTPLSPITITYLYIAFLKEPNALYINNRGCTRLFHLKKYTSSLGEVSLTDFTPGTFSEVTVRFTLRKISYCFRLRTSMICENVQESMKYHNFQHTVFSFKSRHSRRA